MTSPPTSYPIGTMPQQSLPIVVVNPYNSAPLSTVSGSGSRASPSPTVPQQALPVVLVDPTTGVPLSGSAVVAYLISISTGSAGRLFSSDFSSDFG